LQSVLIQHSVYTHFLVADKKIRQNVWLRESLFTYIWLKINLGQLLTNEAIENMVKN